MRRALPLLVGVVIGVVAGALLAILGVPTLWVGILAITALMFGPHLYMRYYLPARLRALLRSLVDPAVGPPKTFEPVDDTFPQRLMDAVSNGTRGLEEWLAEDFVMIDARGKRHDARRYLATQRAMLNAYPDLTERVEALHADFEQPNVLWMLSNQTGHPRRGPALDATIWSRLTLTRDRERIREIAFEGVIRAD
jgi:hypothetical protein